MGDVIRSGDIRYRYVSWSKAVAEVHTALPRNKPGTLRFFYENGKRVLSDVTTDFIVRLKDGDELTITNLSARFMRAWKLRGKVMHATVEKHGNRVSLKVKTGKEYYDYRRIPLRQMHGKAIFQLQSAVE